MFVEESLWITPLFAETTLVDHTPFFSRSFDHPLKIEVNSLRMVNLLVWSHPQKRKGILKQHFEVMMWCLWVVFMHMHSLVAFFGANGHLLVFPIVILQNGQACYCTTTPVKFTGRYFDAMVTPTACFASGHRKIHRQIRQDLRKLDIKYRNLARAWHHILHEWNAPVLECAEQAWNYGPGDVSNNIGH